MAKRRVLGKIVLPFTSRELLRQLKQAMKALESVIIPTPYSIEDFARLLEKFPLLASPLSALRPADCRFFWDTFGVWLLEKGFEPQPKVFSISPSIGRHAHRTDIEVLAFASHHPWPSVIWRDIHCYRCFLLKTFNPTRAFDKQCTKHRCQTWAKQILNSHTPIDPKWSQFTDIGNKYGTVVSFQFSDDDLNNADEVQPLPTARDQEPVLAWASRHEMPSDDEVEEQRKLSETSVSSKEKSEKPRRHSISKPLQFLNNFKTDGNDMSKHRTREHKLKMKKGGKKYSLVATYDKKQQKTTLQDIVSSSSDEIELIY